MTKRTSANIDSGASAESRYESVSTEGRAGIIADSSSPVGITLFNSPNSESVSVGNIRVSETTSERPGSERSGRYSIFRRHCQDLRLEIGRIDDFISGGIVSEEGLEVVIEVEAILEKLYDCPWGEGESLKKIVVLLQSQLLNAKWTINHVKLIQNSVHLLTRSYLVNDDLVREVANLVEEEKLDQFRGTVSDTGIQKQYRLQEVKNEQCSE